MNNFNGRTSKNMGNLKYEEYCKLTRYLIFGFKPHFGKALVIYRFYKNLKYRKKWIRDWKEWEKT